MRYIRNPFVTTDRCGEHVDVNLVPYGVRVRASAALADVLETFAQPAPLSAAGTASNELLGQLVDWMLLLPATDASALARGLLVPAPAQLGTYTAPTAWRRSMRLGQTVLFGAPFDSSAAAGPSPKMGPAAVRRQLAILAERQPGVLEDVCDLGDILHLAHDESLAVAGERARFLVASAIAAGATPIMVGGDHSLTYYALQACAQRVNRFAVLFLDAHGDVGRASHPCLDMVNHACFVRHALKLESLACLLAVGVRDDAGSNTDVRIERICARRTQELDAAAIIDRLPADLPVYLSVDIDVLDPAFAPDVLYPVADGLSVACVANVVSEVAERFQILGADVMEVGSTCRATDPTPAAAAQLLAALMGSIAATSSNPRNLERNP